MSNFRTLGLLWLMLPFKILVAQYLPSNQHTSPSTTITVQFDGRYKGDTVVCEYSPSLYSAGMGKSKYDTLMRVINEDGIVTFTFNKISPDGYAYVNISRDYWQHFLNTKPLMINCLLKKGDHITAIITSPQLYSAKSEDLKELKSRQYQITFVGKGASKFSMSYVGLQPLRMIVRNLLPIFGEDGTYNEHNGYITVGEQKINRLNSFKGEMDSLSFQMIKADIVGRFLSDAASSVQKPNRIDVQTKRLRSNFLSMITILSKGISEKAKALSLEYSRGLFEMEHARIGTYDSTLFACLTAHYKGRLLDRVIGIYLTSGHNQDPLPFVTFALAKVSNDDFRTMLSAGINRSPGRRAYPFKLISTTGDSISLSSLSGKTVLIDTYFKGCPGCILYYQNVLKDLEHQFKDSAVVFLSISVDAVKDNWDESLKSGLYTSTDLPNVLNLSLGPVGLRHPLLSYYNILGFPTAILIDHNGQIIRYESPDLKTKDGLTKLLIDNLDKMRRLPNSGGHIPAPSR